MTWSTTKQEAVLLAMAEFGEPVVFHPDASAIPDKGIFTLVEEGQEFGGVVPSAPAPALEVLPDTLVSAAIEEGTQVYVRAKRYTVISIGSHDPPSVTLELQEY